MKLAFVGNVINHGISLSTVGTGLVFTLADIEGVELIDVYTSTLNENPEDAVFPPNVTIRPTYTSNSPLSTLKLFSINWSNYDVVIFNILPTTFGKSSILNMIGITSPLILKILGYHNIKVIYHNSTFTNDVEKLGYDTFFDKIRKKILSITERIIFKQNDVYMPLQLYVNKIQNIIPNACVNHINMRYIEGLVSIYLSEANKFTFIDITTRPKGKPTVLLHGYWGPQKNLEAILPILEDIHRKIDFKLIISGTINSSFPGYLQVYNKLMNKYKNIVSDELGYVPESKILDLFSRCDCVIIPYKTSGGASGVIEVASTLEIPIVSISFPEYEEQARDRDNIHMTDQEHLSQTIIEQLKYCQIVRTKNYINIQSKISHAKKSISKLLD